MPELNSNQPKTCLFVLLSCCCWWTHLSCYATRPHFKPRTILEQLLLLLLGRNIYWCKAYFMGSSSHLPAVYPQNNLIFQQGLILVEGTNRLPNVRCFSLNLFLSFDSINFKTVTSSVFESEYIAKPTNSQIYHISGHKFPKMVSTNHISVAKNQRRPITYDKKMLLYNLTFCLLIPKNCDIRPRGIGALLHVFLPLFVL